MNRRHALSVFLSFVFGIAVGLSAPGLFHLVVDRFLFPVQRTDVARASSPDGRVDAVAESLDCGAPCSSMYAVSVVPKGAACSDKPAQRVFLAEDIVNPRIKWNEPHLLDIVYEKALIQSFRNVAYPLRRPGNPESWSYAVEVQLSPSSSRFSYLTDRNQVKPSQ